jgi:hypothetical protein
MRLHSRLFKNDRALEACLIHDSAHVTPGAKGAHVSKIQTALLALAHTSVAVSELRENRYGQSTAAAVLLYKKRRRIINYSYQTHADNIVGKMTIKAMDWEMRMMEILALRPPCPDKNLAVT